MDSTALPLCEYRCLTHLVGHVSTIAPTSAPVKTVRLRQRAPDLVSRVGLVLKDGLIRWPRLIIKGVGITLHDYTGCISASLGDCIQSYQRSINDVIVTLLIITARSSNTISKNRDFAPILVVAQGTARFGLLIVVIRFYLNTRVALQLSVVNSIGSIIGRSQ